MNKKQDTEKVKLDSLTSQASESVLVNLGEKLSSRQVARRHGASSLDPGPSNNSQILSRVKLEELKIQERIMKSKPKPPPIFLHNNMHNFNSIKIKSEKNSVDSSESSPKRRNANTLNQSVDCISPLIKQS